MKAAEPSSEYWITRPVQVRALASPVRQEVIDVLESAGPCTMARLGLLLARRPDGLYFHIRRLVKVGLIVERGSVREGRHVAAVFDLPGRPMRLSYAPPVAPKDMAAVVRAALRTGAREYSSAVRDHFGTEVSSGGTSSPPYLWSARAKGWLTAEEAGEVKRLVRQATAILRGGAPRPGTRAVALSLSFAPAAEAKRRKKGAAVDAGGTGVIGGAGAGGGGTGG